MRPSFSYAPQGLFMFSVRGKEKQLMKGAREEVCMEEGNCCKPMTRYSTSLAIYFVLLFLTLGAMQAQAKWPYVVPSEDGTPISYEIYGPLTMRQAGDVCFPSMPLF